MGLRHFLLITSLVLFSAVRLTPEEAHQQQHHHDPSERLGRVNFPVSCSPAAQQEFNRATALLHSFWYEEAEKTFQQVTKLDASCTMGFWGMAMSNYHPLWAPPSPDELKRGRAAVEKAKVIPAKTERERGYMTAVEAFYRDSDTLVHHARAVAYEKAMEQVYQRHPGDREASIFYALSLLGTALPTDKTYANQKKAAEILNRVLPDEPEHPGVAHYIIHSFDYPQLAELALPAARAYAKIAPSSPHALHMPTHIFTRLGLWQESITGNIASAASAKNHVAKTHPGAGSYDQLHAMDYLAYAYLQRAQDQKARELYDELRQINRLDLEAFQAAYAFAAVPARYALERRRWTEAAALNLHPDSFPWKQYPYAEAITYFARALGAARGGDVVAARKDLDKLASIQQALAETKNSYWADQVEIQRRAASAWIAFAAGDRQKSLDLMRTSAELEDSTEKHPVTPGPIVPARELLGELLLELNQPAQALRDFETALSNSPNRFNGLYGAARAAELSGDAKKAQDYYQRLVVLCDKADGSRPEILRAKEFLKQAS